MMTFALLITVLTASGECARSSQLTWSGCLARSPVDDGKMHASPRDPALDSRYRPAKEMAPEGLEPAYLYGPSLQPELPDCKT